MTSPSADTDEIALVIVTGAHLQRAICRMSIAAVESWNSPINLYTNGGDGTKARIESGPLSTAEAFHHTLLPERYLEFLMRFLDCLSSGLALPDMIVSSEGLQLRPIEKEQTSSCNAKCVSIFL